MIRLIKKKAGSWSVRQEVIGYTVTRLNPGLLLFRRMVQKNFRKELKCRSGIRLEFDKLLKCNV